MNAAPQPELELPITASPPPKRAADRWAIAVHEAGHAVAAVFYEIPLTAAFVILHEVGSDTVAGRVRYDWEKVKLQMQSSPRARCASKLIVMGYAGFFAELKAKPSAHNGDSEYDGGQIHNFLLKHFSYKRKSEGRTGSQQTPPEAEIARAYNARSRRLVLVTRRLVDWLYPIIVMVALTLLERRRMTGEEVVALAGPLIAKKRAAMNGSRRLKSYEIMD